MAPPAKKQKLSGSAKKPAQSKGLEYFFNKQAQAAVPPSSNPEEPKPVAVEDDNADLTDEQLAQKLQAEWNQEVRSERQSVSSESKATEAGTEPVDAPTEVKAEVSKDASRATNKEPTASPVKQAGLREIIQQMESPKKEPDASPRKSQESAPVNPFFQNPRNTLSLQSGGADEDIVSQTIPFDESPLTFEPSKYVPDLRNAWAEHGGSASYALLARAFVLVNGTQSRIKIVDTLVNLLRTIIEGDPGSLLPAVSRV